ncbi:MAG: hypothetical protein ACI9OU_001117, partial [Candidatus Promineifilaceae bacterium]
GDHNVGNFPVLPPLKTDPTLAICAALSNDDADERCHLQI